MSTFFTADQHFWHKNIIEYTNRPFSSVKEMNSTIIDNYRSIVGADDTVWFLGDLMLGGGLHKGNLECAIDQLPGEKHLVLGNHDRLTARDYMDIGFVDAHSWFPLDLPLDDSFPDRVFLTHDPAAVQNVTMNALTAHVHNRWVHQGSCINVGVDVWDFKPVSYEEIVEVVG